MTPAGNPRSMNPTISHHPRNQPFPGKWLSHYHIILSETTINHFSPPKKKKHDLPTVLTGFDIAIFFGSLNIYDQHISINIYQHTIICSLNSSVHPIWISLDEIPHGRPPQILSDPLSHVAMFSKVPSFASSTFVSCSELHHPGGYHHDSDHEPCGLYGFMWVDTTWYHYVYSTKIGSWDYCTDLVDVYSVYSYNKKSWSSGDLKPGQQCWLLTQRAAEKKQHQVKKASYVESNLFKSALLFFWHP